MPLLLKLPPEIHRIILEHLSKQHEPSVRAFAGVSRTFHALAMPYLYHTLEITAQDTEGFDGLVETIGQTLQRNGGLQYVKRLVVDGELMSRGEYEFDQREKSTKRVEIFADNLHGCLDHYEGYPRDLGPEHADEDPLPDYVYPPSSVWLPLASLVKRLPSLSDLIFLSPNQFPQCLLETIHRHRPECRLHIRNFFLRSLKAPLRDTYDFQLATSPCLFSISTEPEGESSRQDIQDKSAQLLPTEVLLWYKWCLSSPRA